jgi:hypothetical protein
LKSGILIIRTVKRSVKKSCDEEEKKPDAVLTSVSILTTGFDEPL